MSLSDFSVRACECVCVCDEKQSTKYKSIAHFLLNTHTPEIELNLKNNTIVYIKYVII